MPKKFISVQKIFFQQRETLFPKFKFLTLIVLSLFSWQSHPKKNQKASAKKQILLSEEDFLKKVISSSPQIQKIKWARQKRTAQILQAKYSLSDWSLFSQWNEGEKSNPSIDNFLSKSSESQSWMLGLQKKIPYGLNFSSSYTSLDEQSMNSDILKQFKASSIYRKNFNLELKANFTEAVSHFWMFKGFSEALSGNELSYSEQAEQALVQALTKYWKSYSSWIRLKQAEESLKTYKKLVRQINDKRKYNFLQPGERPQILAEYQNIQKALDMSRQNYNETEKDLLLYLKKDPAQHFLSFKIQTPKSPPHFSKINLQKIRSLQILKKKIKNQKLNLMAEKSSLFPMLELTGKKGWTPADTQPDLSFSSNESFYEVGLSLKWILFSKSFYKKIQQKQYELKEDQIDLEILSQEITNNMNLLDQQIKMAFKNIKRTNKASAYQRQAFKELEKAFNQGRVDIFQLIQTEKQMRSAEIQKSQALAEYSISLASILALRDELLDKYL